MIPRNELGLRQDPSTLGWMQDYFNVTLAGQIREVDAPQRGATDDRYFVTYLMTTSGTYELSIRLDTPGRVQRGMHIEGSPFSVTIVSASAVAVKTEADGDGLETAVAGDDTT